MFFVHLIFALCIALILSAVFAWGLRQKGPWASFVAFFLLIFLASWAGGVWLQPMGPFLWGYQWVPFLLVGLIFALFLAAIPVSPESSVDLVSRKKEEEEKRAVLSAFGVFWILIIALIVAIGMRYTAYTPVS
jgi:hypothetical protein